MKIEPITPFEPILTESLPTGDNWVAQIKWDGVRMLTYFDGNEVRLINRKLNDRTLQYPEFLDLSRYCHATSVILDGEIIAFDSNKPSFHEIMKRDRIRKKQSIPLAVNQTPVTYMFFDVLFLNGSWVTEKPLRERQELLEQIITPLSNVQVVQNFQDAHGLYEVMKQHQMEGIVCKDLSSSYLMKGKDKRWQKKKIFHDLLAVVGGVTLRDGIVNAVLLGLYDESGNFIYIGHAGGGKLTNQDWRALTETIKPLVTTERPFHNQPERGKDAIWIKPKLVMKVQFMEWTTGLTMRHPTIQAIVNASLLDCTFSQNG
ncbi:DNA ligase [Brevibacillus nitrificans]|uniref:DNA ligase (ATP) n=1 Tax=Brevibacillus nitrificans TaxID=651560 RepID=A0A3M8DIV7_9BACL|nr:RNA ligase family protein [Brevibacillus nitrificans]RNB88033.1 DNA ligase [Brevibacillus nitrificans]